MFDLVTTPTAKPSVLMVAIVKRSEGEKVAKLFSTLGAVFNLAALGKGTVSPDIAGYLGLTDKAKDILVSVMPLGLARKCLHALADVIAHSKPGYGIAFTIRLSSASGLMAARYLSDPTQTESGDDVEQTCGHDLIIAIVNRGFADEVMDAARSVEATGGTVLNARGTGLKVAEKFFGVTIQPEKELVLILTRKDHRRSIMKAISDKAGLQTRASTFVFSLPVNDVIEAPQLTRE